MEKVGNLLGPDYLQSHGVHERTVTIMVETLPDTHLFQEKSKNAFYIIVKRCAFASQSPAAGAATMHVFSGRLSARDGS